MPRALGIRVVPDSVRAVWDEGCAGGVAVRFEVVEVLEDELVVWAGREVGVRVV